MLIAAWQQFEASGAVLVVACAPESLRLILQDRRRPPDPRRERALEHALLSTAERHPVEHEVHHVAIDLVRWSHEHTERIARAVEPQGLHLPDPAVPPIVRQRTERPSHALEEPSEPDLRLLSDLRALHLAATGNSLYWEILAQAAQATGDSRLLELATDCHPQTLRQMPLDQHHDQNPLPATALPGERPSPNRLIEGEAVAPGVENRSILP